MPYACVCAYQPLVRELHSLDQWLGRLCAAWLWVVAWLRAALIVVSSPVV